MKKQMKKERIFYIDFIKVISTILILVYHFYEYLDRFNVNGIDRIFYYTINGTEHGAVALNGLAAFFIVSGVALMYKYSEKINYKEYAFKRFKSIFPMFWITYILVYLYDFFITKKNQVLPIHKFLLTIVGVDGYFLYLSPNFYKVGEWFLGAIIFLYIVFPLFRKLIKKGKKIATIVVILLAIASALILTYYPFTINYKRNMVICIFLFVFGIYFWEYIKEIKWYQALISLVIYIVFRTINFTFLDAKFQIYIPAVVSFFIFVYISKFITNRNIKKVFEILSKYSYAIFLVHTFVINEVLVKVQGKTLTNLEGFGVFMLITIIIGILSKLLYMITMYISNKTSEIISVKKEFLIKNLPFFVYTFLIAMLHVEMKIRGDDQSAIRILQQTSFTEWMDIRYNIWTSRIIIDAIMIVMIKFKYVIWKIFNIGMFLLLPYSINKIFNEKNDLKLKWFICIVTLLIPASCYGGAGWAATSINYIWPLVFLIISCIPIKKNFKNEKLTVSEKILSILTLIVASNHEQIAGILAIFYVITLIYNSIKKKKNNWILICTLITLLSLLFILTCPGNKYRSISEAKIRFPNYQTFNFIDKIELGITSMMKFIILENNLVFLITTFVIMSAVFITNKSKIFRILSVIPFIGSVVSLNSLNNILPDQLNVIKDVISKFNTETLISGLFTNNNILGFYIMFVYYMIYLFCIIISIYAIFKNTDKSAFLIILFGVGVVSRIVLGFSSTVFASGERTALFLYVSCIIIVIYIWEHLRELKRENKVINIVILMLCLIAYIQNYLTVLRLRN